MKKKVDKEALWNDAVAKAKQFCEVSQINQMLVAGLALEVCEISWGGNHTKQKFTLSRFADEVGISGKKLSSWVAVRKTVYDKLPDEDRTGVSYTKLAQVSFHVAPDASKQHVREKFNELVNRDGFNSKMLRCLADLRSIAYNFHHKDAAEKVADKTCQEFLFYTKVISRSILKHHKGMKGVDHGFASRANFTNISAARALMLPRGDKGFSRRIKAKDPEGHELHITPKDREIAIFMLKHDKKFFSPTDLGMRLKGHNSNSASAWACRTLNKLLAAGMVDRNDKGHYRWKGGSIDDKETA